jgi:phosphatidylglycerophosphate synthase
MLTISNCLSFVRIPLAFVFLTENAYLRFFGVLLAMITDSIDGHLARKTQSVSRFGAVLDPVTDKFFVYFALTVLFFESKLEMWQAVLMLSRDIAILIYGSFMLLCGRLKSVVVASLQSGKVSTALQFLLLMGLVFDVTIPLSSYSLFVILGSFALIEQFRRASPFAATGNWNIFGCQN